jgi:quercetin dioxygenase-like cupin family protein
MDGTATGATATTATTATTARPDIRLSVVSKDSAPLVPGRRKFFRYRDLGVSAATGGRLRAQVMEAITGMTEPTGWHTHQCEAQVVSVLKGWVELEFEDGTRTRSGPGDAILIPGGMKHNEIATSDDVEILELSIPGDMATQPCDPPPGMGAGAPGR